MLQFSAHHAGTGLHVLDLGHAGAQFREGEIGMLAQFGSKELGTRLERALGTMGLGPWGRLPRRTLLVPPFLDGGNTDAKERRNCLLGLVARFDRHEDAVAQILRIGSHGLQCT